MDISACEHPFWFLKNGKSILISYHNKMAAKARAGTHIQKKTKNKTKQNRTKKQKQTNKQTNKKPLKMDSKIIKMCLVN